LRTHEIIGLLEKRKRLRASSFWIDGGCEQSFAHPERNYTDQGKKKRHDETCMFVARERAINRQINPSPYF